MFCSLLLAALPFQVVVPQNIQPWEKTAAGELKEFLGQRVTKALTLSGAGDVVFHVGDTALAAEKGLLSSKLEEERWVIRSFGRNVVLNGGGSRGAIYAVSHFLEDFCGVRFWSENEIDVPASETFDLPALDATGRPAFRYRDIYRTSTTDPRGRGVARHAFRRRLNRSGDWSEGSALGGTFTYGPPYHCHTYKLYIPEEKYMKDHPEYFSYVDGKHIGGEAGGICLTNPDVRRIMHERLWEFVAQGDARAKGKGLPPPRMYEVSLNDGGADCRCANCLALAEKYGWSGAHLSLVNDLADDLAAKRPELFISMLLYCSAEPPPKGGIRPRDNVIVKLCDTKTSQFSPITDPRNKIFRDYLDGWGRISKNIIIWDYAPLFQNPLAFFAFPSEFAFPTDYRYFLDHNVFGVFLEHEYPDLGDLFDIKYYLECKLYEDPHQDEEALRREAFGGYFGPGWEPIYRSRKYLYDKAQEKGIFVNFAPWKLTDMTSAYCLADLEKTTALWDEAERLAKDSPRHLRRIRFARRSNDSLLHYYRQSFVKSADGKLTYEAAAFDVKPGLPYEVVADPDSPSGKTLRFDVDRSVTFEFEPPFEWGYWDAPKGKATSGGKVPKPKTDTYEWADLGEITLPGDQSRYGGRYNGYFYLESLWGPHLRICDFESQGKTFRVRILMRATGARYHLVDTRPNELFVARVELTPVVGKATDAKTKDHVTAGSGI